MLGAYPAAAKPLSILATTIMGTFCAAAANAQPSASGTTSISKDCNKGNKQLLFYIQAATFQFHLSSSISAAKEPGAKSSQDGAQAKNTC